MLEASVRKTEVADAEELWAARNAHGGRLAKRQCLDGFLDTWRQHLTGCGIHGSCVAVEVTLDDTHRRSIDKQVEEGVLLFEPEVLAAQTTQQVVERADDDVGLMLSRRSEARRQVEFPHQFHAANQCVVWSDGLAVEVPEVEQYQDYKALGDVEQCGVTAERSEERYAGQQDNAYCKEEEIMLQFHSPCFSILRYRAPRLMPNSLATRERLPLCLAMQAAMALRSMEERDPLPTPPC